MQPVFQETSPRKRFCSFAIMAKVWSVGILFAVSVIIMLIVLGDSVSNGQRTRVLKRKKALTPATTTAPPAATPVPPAATTVPPAAQIVPVTENVYDMVMTYATTSNIQNDKQEIALVFPTDGSTGGNELHGVILPASLAFLKGNEIRESGLADLCPEKCERENCPPIASPCPLGHVLDRCSCCYHCAVGEGSRCYNSTNPNTARKTDEGICGAGLLCLDRSDLQPGEEPEALCECRNTRKICGTDNVTYSSECKLREASHLKPELGILSWSPCVLPPWVTTTMENVTGEIGSDLSLSCEFRSFPSPVIHWEFSPEGSSERLILPGDDSSIIQTNRGGPEEMMTTSFLQILAVTPRRQGTYFCLAKNTEGTVQSNGLVSVYKRSNST